MASLTEISISSRRVIRYGVYALILILIGRFTFNMTVAIYKRLNPPPPPPPDTLFGKLPTLPFPNKDFPESLRFTVETADNILPEFPLSMPVFQMIARTPAIKALDEARETASSLGFESEGRPIVENVKNVYVFERPRSQAQLTMNIVTGVFSVSYDLKSDPTAIQTFPPSVEEATKEAIGFFNGVENGAGIAESIVTTQFLRLENGVFVPGFSQSDSQFIKVNLFRKNFGENGEYPSVTPNMPEANIWILYGGSKEKRLIAAEYHYYQVDETKRSTYPIMTAEAALNMLKEGKAYIANMREGATQVTIQKIYLGYYDPETFTDFYQPVVVFEGDDGFYAYVPAVTEDYIAEETE